MRGISLVQQGTDDLLARSVGELRDVLARPLPPCSERAMEQLKPLPGSRVVYVSTPITTGPAYLDWLAAHRGARPDDRERARQAMVTANISAVKPLVRAVPDRFPHAHVIDPTALEDVQGWEQADYHRFWVEVIATHVDEVVFADGWTASIGCSVEFAVTMLRQLPAYRSDFSPLTEGDGVKELLAMAPRLKEAGASDEMHLAVANTLARELQ